MARKKKEKTIVVFGQEVKVDEYGVIDWSSVRIPKVKIPEGKAINDMIEDVPPNQEDKKD